MAACLPVPPVPGDVVASRTLEAEEVVGLVEGAQRPAVDRGSCSHSVSPVLVGRRWAPVAGSADAEEQPHRRHDHAGVAHGDDRLAVVVARQAVERPADPPWKLFQLSPPGANTRSGSASMSNEP